MPTFRWASFQERIAVSMVPTYPMGLPLLLLAVAHVAGWNLAPSLTIVFHSLFGLWLVYLLGREFGLEAGWAWLGAMLLAASPLVYPDVSAADE